MADEEGYEKLVALIEDVEATTKRSELNYVSAAPAFAGNAMEKRSYDTMVDFIDMMEGGGVKKPKEAPKEKEMKQVPSPHIVTSGLAQARYATEVPRPQAAGAPAAQAAQLGKPPSEAVQRHKENIMKELGAVAAKFGKPKAQIPIKKKKARMETLVLPNLSLADQISELERIIEGLKEQVFDPEHLTIITDELAGLRQTVVEEVKGKKREKLNSLEQSLWDLRYQRLTDAINLIRQYGAS